MCWVRQCDLRTEHVALFVNSNLALELPADADRQSTSLQAKPDPRAELAAQFIPAGARILDLGASPASRTLVPNGCSYVGAGKKRRTRDIGLNTEKFPTEVAMQAELIVMLGVLERVKDIESYSLSIGERLENWRTHRRNPAKRCGCCLKFGGLPAKFGDLRYLFSARAGLYSASTYKH